MTGTFLKEDILDTLEDILSLKEINFGSPILDGFDDYGTSLLSEFSNHFYIVQSRMSHVVFLSFFFIF